MFTIITKEIIKMKKFLVVCLILFLAITPGANLERSGLKNSNYGAQPQNLRNGAQYHKDVNQTPVEEEELTNINFKHPKLKRGFVESNEGILAENWLEKQLIKLIENSQKGERTSNIRRSRSTSPLDNKGKTFREMVDSLLKETVKEYRRSKDGSDEDEKKDIYRRKVELITDDDDDDSDRGEQLTTTMFDSDEVTSEKYDSEDSGMNSCDFVSKRICWFERLIGDSLTMVIKMGDVTQEKGPFDIKWARIYGARQNQPPFKAEIESARTPWNVVIGGGGTELRLSPITDTDLDRNAFIAKVFSKSKNHDKNTPKLLKKFEFRINTVPFDRGSLYTDEQLNINIENFVTLPERGIIFDWVLETSSDSVDSLPSNMKISRSGRSVVITELKKNQKGILTCIMYSSTGLAVAKRRFKINSPKPVEKRSESQNQHIIVNSMHQHTESSINKEKQSKKGFSNEFQYYRYPSWQRRVKRSLMGLIASNDKVLRQNPPILYILKKRETQEMVKFPSYSSDHWKRQPTHHRDGEKRIEKYITPHPIEFFVQSGDDTLDDVIPKEVRYVNPTVITVWHKNEERSSDKRPEMESVFNCTTNYDCGPKASCVFQNAKESTDKVRSGLCTCNSEYEGDGIHCYRLPYKRRREKRVKRQMSDPSLSYNTNDISLRRNLFYSDGQMAQAIPPQPAYQNIPQQNYGNVQQSLYNNQNVLQQTLDNQNNLQPIPNNQDILQSPNNNDNQNNLQPASNNQNILQPSNNNDNQNIPQPTFNNQNSPMSANSNDNQNIPQLAYNNQNVPQQTPENQNIPQLVYNNQNIPLLTNNVPQQPPDNQNIPQLAYNNQNVPQQAPDNQNIPQLAYNNQNVPPITNNVPQQLPDNQNIPQQIINTLNGHQSVNNQQKIIQGNGYDSIPPVQAMQNTAGDTVLQPVTGDDIDSALLGKCQNKEFCSPHADCLRPQSSIDPITSYCKCAAGYRGNGIFCWEIADYVAEPQPILDRQRFRIHWKRSK